MKRSVPPVQAAECLLKMEGEYVAGLLAKHPDYHLVFVGHSLGAGERTCEPRGIIRNQSTPIFTYSSVIAFPWTSSELDLWGRFRSYNIGIVELEGANQEVNGRESEVFRNINANLTPHDDTRRARLYARQVIIQ